VQPVVAGNEVAARIAHDRHVHLADLLDHVLAEAVGVGKLRLRIVDAFVDRAAQMLKKGAEQAAIHLGAHTGLLDDHARWSAGLREAETVEPGGAGRQRAGGSKLLQEITTVGLGHGSPSKQGERWFRCGLRRP
jgi:hypothetical protein